MVFFRINRRTRSLLGILLLGGWMAPTQDALFAQAPGLEFSVHGTVLDSSNHQPIARALVKVDSDAALTDNDGHFELELPQGENLFLIQRPGFREMSQSIPVQVGPNTPELTFELTPAVFLSGHITLSNGEPAEGIVIHLYRRSIVNNNREQWTDVQHSVTNTDGGFRFPNLRRGGSYIVCTEPAGEDTAEPASNTQTLPPVRVGYPGTCTPGPIPTITGRASERDSANTLRLTPGQHAEVEMQLTRQPFYHVELSVLNPERWAISGSQASIQSATETSIEYSAQWNATRGLVDAYLPNGQYTASVGSDGNIAGYGLVRFQVAGKPLNGPRIPLIPINPITVEIHKDLTVTPPPEQPGNKFERSATNGPGLNLALIPTDPFAPSGQIAGGGLEALKGSSSGSLFQTTSAVPGRYWVEVYPFEGYVASATSGGVDLTRQPITIGPGGTAPPILITLRNDVGKIEATVRTNPDDGSGGIQSTRPGTPGKLARAFLYAFPESRMLWQIPQAQSQGSDPAMIENLPPGTYRVVALDHPQEFNLSDAEQTGWLSSVGQSVTVSPGATANVQLTLVHAVGEEPEEGGVTLD